MAAELTWRVTVGCRVPPSLRLAVAEMSWGSHVHAMVDQAMQRVLNSSWRVCIEVVFTPGPFGLVGADLQEILTECGLRLV